MSYWNKILRSRISRRRALLAGGGAAAGALLLSACAGGDGDANDSGDRSGLVAPQVDNLKNAKPGGTLRIPASSDVRSYQPYLRDASVNFHTWISYSFLVRTKSTAFSYPAPDELVPDGAQSWEWSPDRLTITFKLQPESKWDQRPPTNGRPVDAEDVVYSWKQVEAVSSIRNELANSVSPSGPILSVTAVDPLTVVMKLAFPQAELLSQLRDYSAATLFLTPREYETSGFDRRSDTRGSGPFYLENYTPSVGTVYVRNPNYWDKTAPYIERIERPIITEYATALSQLKSGAIYYYGDGDTDAVRSEDIVQTKRDVPELVMTRTDVSGANRYWMYSTLPNSPWRDVRVRHALQLSFDRDLWIDTFFNVETFRAQGLPVDTALNTCVNCNYTGYWLDPRGKDFGEAAKWYRYDVAEAKKLLAAAGYPDGLDVDAPFITTSQYGPTFPREMEVLWGMATEAGFRPKFASVDYNNEWATRFVAPARREDLGKFPGATAQLASTSSRIWMWALLNSAGSFFRGFDADGSGRGQGDPELNRMTELLLREFDQQRAYQLAHDIQRRQAEMAYADMFPGGANGFRLAWPVVGNFGVYRQDRWFKTVYIDETKPPLTRT